MVEFVQPGNYYYEEVRYLVRNAIKIAGVIDIPNVFVGLYENESQLPEENEHTVNFVLFEFERE